MKKKVVFISLLKSISDPRIDKFFSTLSQSFVNCEFHIIATDDSTQSKYNALPLEPKSNRSQKRKKALSYLKGINPDIVIFNNIDLITSLLRIPKTTLLYDIRENHIRNIYYQSNYPWYKKTILIPSILSLEFFSTFFIRHYFLAEQCYKKQLSHISKRKTTILENKALDISYSPTSTRLHFIISGSLSRNYGTIEAIKWFKEYQIIEPFATLIVIGKTYNISYHQEIQNECIHPGIKINISNESIPYLTIKNEITQADIGIMSYQNNKSFKDKVPTKLYEYISAGKIVVSADHSPINTGDNNVIRIEIANYQEQTLERVKEKLAKSNAQLNPNTSWESEKQKLIDEFKKILV